MSRLSWPPILEQSAGIVRSYDTGVTLRQLFYRLVALEVLPNTVSAYKTLSARTAEARRAGWFPRLIDRGRMIHRPLTFTGADDARRYLDRVYQHDRTRNMDVSIYLGVEHAGIIEQLWSWFGQDLCLPIVALGGYSSQSYIDEIVPDVQAQERPAVLIYGGDFDASGEDIDRDFLKRTACFDKVIRIALSADQVVEYGLPVQMGKAKDSRAAGFIARHGELVQVELDALPPDVLRSLYADALSQFWDESAYLSVLELEAAERVELQRGNANGS